MPRQTFGQTYKVGYERANTGTRYYKGTTKSGIEVSLRMGTHPAAKWNPGVDFYNDPRGFVKALKDEGGITTRATHRRTLSMLQEDLSTEENSERIEYLKETIAARTQDWINSL